MSKRRHGAPRLSVVTPLFNCLDLTQAMVASLVGTLPAELDYEIILVDDGSTDGTRRWLSGLAAPYRVILNERNLGYAASTNRGAAAATGDVLALLNNDLVLQRGWLEPMMGALDDGVGIVGNVQVNASTGAVDHAGISISLKGKPEHDRPSPLGLHGSRAASAVTGACMLASAETWRRLGGFDEGFVNGCEDVDLCLRARAVGLRVAVARDSRVLHHVSSSPGRKLRDEENAMRLVLRWREQFALDASRLWSRDCLATLLPDPRDFPSPREALKMLLYVLHLTWSPPPSAVEGMGGAIDRELARWREMFSH